MFTRSLQTTGIFVSIALLLILAFTMAPALNQAYQSKFMPVTKYSTTVVKREGRDVFVHLSGEKLRDCLIVPKSLNSYYLRNGIRVGVSEERYSGDSSSRPVGFTDLGVFVIHDVPVDAQSIEMYVQHDCAGTVLLSLVASANLMESRHGITK